MGRVIVAVSGGKASAWCANWAIQKYGKDNVVLYFNDTKWEHPDLYRFLSDLSGYFGKEITHDDDGRSPEQLFYDHHALANNRMPFCSHILKAKRLQKYYKNGDTIVFGIGMDEMERARRIISVYQIIAAKTGKLCRIELPILTNNISSDDIDRFIVGSGIQEPILYKMGFMHNNCSGGCVRAGKKHWKLLYEKLPDIYMERERVEEEVRSFLGKDVHFFKDETLRSFRLRIEHHELSSYYDVGEEKEVECIGICDTQS